LPEAADALHVEAVLTHVGTSTPIDSVVGVDLIGRCVNIALSVPPTAQSGSVITVARASIGGLPVTGFPKDVSVVCGMYVPLQVDHVVHKHRCGPCISPDGRLYVPHESELNADMMIFDARGVRTTHSLIWPRWTYPSRSTVFALLLETRVFLP